MQNFEFQNPVKILFGKGQIAKLSKEIPSDAKVLMIYGGGSIKANGVYDQVMEALAGHAVLEFGGIEPNPTYETLMPAVELARREEVDFLLAVGGGSVVDGTKFIAAAIPFEEDPWEILQGTPARVALPLGVVLTLPATGSEMNGFSVVSRRSTQEKLSFGSRNVYPQFSILDPETTFSLPLRQVGNGIVDAFVHTTEQYLTYPTNAPLQDRMAESILKTLIEEGPKTYANPRDYDSRANVMWCATMALNGIIGLGVPQDWATHAIGHELTALYGIDHARTLAIVLPSLLESRKEAKREKLLQYAERVWNLSTGSDAERIAAAIARTRTFFESVGVPTRLGAYDAPQEAATLVADRLASRGVTRLGERGELAPDGVRALLAQSF
jgi:NADP-dependent alcohol dehydrogenase